jgi:hypothetical protein
MDFYEYTQIGRTPFSESMMASFLWCTSTKEMIFATKQLIKSVKEGKLDGIRLEKIGIIDDKC